MQLLNKFSARYNRLFSRVILCSVVFLFLFSLVLGLVGKTQSVLAISSYQSSELISSSKTQSSATTQVNFSDYVGIDLVKMFCIALDDGGNVRTAEEREDKVYCVVKNKFDTIKDKPIGYTTLENCSYVGKEILDFLAHRCGDIGTKAKVQKFDPGYNLDYIDVYLFHTKVAERINDNKEEIPVDFELGQNYDTCRFANTGEPCEAGSDKPYYKTRTLNIKKKTLAEVKSNDPCQDSFCGTSSIWDYGTFLLGCILLFYLSIVSIPIGIIYVISVSVNKSPKQWSKYVLLLLSVLVLIISLAILYLAQLYNNYVLITNPPFYFFN